MNIMNIKLKPQTINNIIFGFIIFVLAFLFIYLISKYSTYTHSMAKTRKRTSNTKIKGIVVLEPNDFNIKGTILLNESSKGITLDYTISGLSDGAHGFHIHQFGDLRDGCTSAGPHFNPYGHVHGGLSSPPDKRHLGDLGNIVSKGGTAKGKVVAPNIKLCDGVNAILGRMLVIHQNKDDLGKGVGKERKESLITGNAGKRLACGIIAISGSV